MSDHLPAAAERAAEAFEDRFGSAPTLLVRSPGRVNLIGDHTDYADGFVLPMAIDRSVWLAVRPRADRLVRMWAELDGAMIEFDLGHLVHQAGWRAYVEGVAYELFASHPQLSGFDASVTADLPSGAGLSSSAALELATARAFAASSGLEWDPTEMAVLSRRAENEWVGMPCGIMDQLVCAAGREGHALLIDCRSLDISTMPLPPGAAVVVLDTTTRRELVASAYGDRRRACEEAARILGVPALRDVDIDLLEARRHELDPTVYRRARHVVNENAAVLAAAAAFEAGDAARFGTLMNQSHASLRDDYEVTTGALDRLATIAQRHPACFGARMTGAGFGGSVVALVAAANVDGFTAAVLAHYRESGPEEGTALMVAASDGVGVVACEASAA